MKTVNTKFQNKVIKKCMKSNHLEKKTTKFTVSNRQFTGRSTKQIPIRKASLSRECYRAVDRSLHLKKVGHYTHTTHAMVKSNQAEPLFLVNGNKNVTINKMSNKFSQNIVFKFQQTQKWETYVPE